MLPHNLTTLQVIEYIDIWLKKYNVQMIGGCCGLGPEYIRNVSAHIRHHNAQVCDSPE